MSVAEFQETQNIYSSCGGRNNTRVYIAGTFLFVQWTSSNNKYNRALIHESDLIEIRFLKFPSLHRDWFHSENPKHKNVKVIYHHIAPRVVTLLGSLYNNNNNTRLILDIESFGYIKLISKLDNNN